jgi:hypothetical protein
MLAAPPDDADIRRILLEHQLLFTEAQTCARWGLGVSRLRKWKRRFKPWRAIVGPREWVIVALWQAAERGVAASELIGWLDYHDHAVYSEAEIAAWLEGLVGEGIARRDADRWVFARPLEAFVF